LTHPADGAVTASSGYRRNLSGGFSLPVWLSVKTLVTLRQARLVPGWVTVFGWVNHLGAEPGTKVYTA